MTSLLGCQVLIKQVDSVTICNDLVAKSQWFQKNNVLFNCNIKKVSKTLTLHWKPVLEVNGKNYGFISAFLNAGLHEEYWENPK